MEKFARAKYYVIIILGTIWDLILTGPTVKHNVRLMWPVSNTKVASRGHFCSEWLPHLCAFLFYTKYMKKKTYKMAVVDDPFAPALSIRNNS